MTEFSIWFANSKIASFLRTFFAIVLASAVADFQKIGRFDMTNWQTWLIVALVAALPPFLRYLNPEDSLS